MRQLLPTGPRAADPLVLYDDPDRRVRPHRPYVLLNMVASVDGSTAVDGVTAGLGNAGDRAIFLHLRDLADAILVGGATVRAERYGPARPNSASVAQRLARGQLHRPPIVVVSRTISFDWTATLFHSGEPRPILLVPGDTDAGAISTAEEFAEVVAVGSGGVDMVAALAELRRRGVSVVLCEGGPSLNGQLVAAGLVDEVCLTVAPVLLAADKTGILGRAGLPAGVNVSLRHVLENDGFLYLRYLVDA